MNREERQFEPELEGQAEPQPAPGDLERAPDEPRYPFWTYGDFVLYLFLTLPLFMIVMAGTTFAIHVLRVPGNRSVYMLAAQFAVYGLSFLILKALFRIRYDRPFWSSLGWSMPRRPSLWLLVGMALAVAVVVAAAVMKVSQVKGPMYELLQDPAALATVAVLAVTVGPVAEELFFRGLLLPLMTRTLGAAAGVIVVGLLFALPHAPQYGWSWKQVLLIAGAGSAFGVVRYVTGSTAAAAIAHAAYNGTFFALYFISQRLGTGPE
ncbi:MAG: CPBP family intramembrane metalloprotease [Acidobacteria bacterium]|nr:CPBP family intramembrane metalloprotease [Acidobacteriota bacterium]